MEIWKDIKDYEGLYQISNKGRVYSYRTNKFLSICYTSKGYQIVGFKINGKQVMKQIHRLVAESFIENPENKPCVNHKDGNKENNCVDNLEWCTYSENNKHAYKTKLRKSHVGYGIKSLKHKLTEQEVFFIREHFKPYDKNYSGRALAKQFNVCPRTICMIVNHKTWRN